MRIPFAWGLRPPREASAKVRVPITMKQEEHLCLRMYADDPEQLDAGMLIHDALYRWARDATGQTHNWPTNSPGTAP